MRGEYGTINLDSEQIVTYLVKLLSGDSLRFYILQSVLIYSSTGPVLESSQDWMTGKVCVRRAAQSKQKGTGVVSPK